MSGIYIKVIEKSSTDKRLKNKKYFISISRRFAGQGFFSGISFSDTKILFIYKCI